MLLQFWNTRKTHLNLSVFDPTIDKQYKNYIYNNVMNSKNTNLYKRREFYKFGLYCGYIGCAKRLDKEVN